MDICRKGTKLCQMHFQSGSSKAYGLSDRHPNIKIVPTHSQSNV